MDSREHAAFALDANGLEPEEWIARKHKEEIAPIHEIHEIHSKDQRKCLLLQILHRKRHKQGLRRVQKVRGIV